MTTIHTTLAKTGLVWALAVAACNNPNTTTDVPISSDVASEQSPGDVVTPTDVGLEDSAIDAGSEDTGLEDVASPDTSSADAAPRLENRGEIVVDEAVTDLGSGPMASRAINSAFGSYEAGACTERTEGACTISRCMYANQAQQFGSAMPRASAGNIAVSVGTSTMTTLRPDADLNYSFLIAGSPTRLWAPSDAIMIRAEGATVPAFTFTASFPSIADGTVGDLPTGTDTITINRANPLAARWTATGSTGEVAVIVQQGTSLGIPAYTYPRAAVTIACLYPAGAGMATIPASVLGSLLADDRTLRSGIDTSALVEGRSVQTMMLGTYRVTLRVRSGSPRANEREATVL